MKNKISGGTIARTVVLILALVNQMLSINGFSPLPIDDAQIEAAFSTGLTVLTSLLAWWKNNSFTQKAIEADKLIK